jgi:aspartate racemase
LFIIRKLLDMSFPKAIQKIVPGIIGGLGPLAHTTFEQILIQQNAMRGAAQDQEHPVWLLLNATNIPDRIESLMEKTDRCVPWFIKYGKFLESAGVDFMVVPCNAAHAFYEKVQPHLQIPWINLIECAIKFISKNYSDIKKVGILGTDTTLQAGLYHQSLENAGFIPVSLQTDPELQKLLMNIIYDLNWGIKATGSQISQPAKKNLRTVVDYLAKQGAEIVIAGCSELSVGFYEIEKIALPWVDPLEIMANITLDLAFGYRSLQSDSHGSSMVCQYKNPGLMSLDSLLLL